MNTTDFWSLIDGARSDADATANDRYDAFASVLVDRLAATSNQTIFEFRQIFEQLHSAVYRWDMWAAAYLIGGGCSDDAFMDFRAGLIAQGQDWYERAAASPDALANHPDVIVAAADGLVEALFNEPVNYAASYAYERINGDEDHCSFYDDYDQFLGSQPERGPSDMGEGFDFDDNAEMHARLSNLARLFKP
ncbi:DUF4240 domain-containing protein [Catenulispora sp. NL8]|uniref:DUF4240 domain-containing protein n=1 Tax=Catenulispora pinistramenti TaxID=2705254 RepID=A0ABS5KKU3_9ACTN|nr:DUF4240 domain-containing protein [Catenulispora pinistramenti]MBS2546655.1 DUF4240 domain-containing protein [Catenulispora pinistramenti]